MMSNSCCSWCFYYYVDFNGFVKCFIFVMQFLFVDFDFFFQCMYFFNRDDYWEYNVQFIESGGMQDGVNLVVQDFFMIYCNMYGMLVEEWVFFFWEVYVWQFFVVVDIYGMDDNGLRVIGFSYCFISCKLFFFSWQCVMVYEQEFGMIQVYVFGVVVFSIFDIVNGINVGVDFNLMVVEGNCWQIFQFCQFGFFFCNLSLQIMQCFNLFVRWVDKNLVVYCVENQIVVVFYLCCDVVGVYDGW